MFAFIHATPRVRSGRRRRGRLAGRTSATAVPGDPVRGRQTVRADPATLRQVRGLHGRGRRTGLRLRRLATVRRGRLPVNGPRSKQRPGQIRRRPVERCRRQAGRPRFGGCRTPDRNDDDDEDDDEDDGDDEQSQDGSRRRRVGRR